MSSDSKSKKKVHNADLKPTHPSLSSPWGMSFPPDLQYPVPHSHVLVRRLAEDKHTSFVTPQNKHSFFVMNASIRQHPAAKTSDWACVNGAFTQHNKTDEWNCA
jgi:hypothetical protein